MLFFLGCLVDLVPGGLHRAGNIGPLHLDGDDGDAGLSVVEFALQYTSSYKENTYTFANNIRTIEGGTLTLERSTLSGNSAGYGGGIFNSQGLLMARSLTLAGNSAANYGGGIVVMKLGTATVGPEELREAVSRDLGKSDP